MQTMNYNTPLNKTYHRKSAICRRHAHSFKSHPQHGSKAQSNLEWFATSNGLHINNFHGCWSSDNCVWISPKPRTASLSNQTAHHRIPATKWDTLVRYLSGRIALLLPSPILDSPATYFMGSFLLPKLLIERIDKERCFCWSDKDTCSGAW